jgi:hypothetical protein
MFTFAGLRIHERLTEVLDEQTASQQPPEKSRNIIIDITVRILYLDS